MKLATENNGTSDGRLLVVSTDLQFAATADGIANTLQNALDNWKTKAPILEKLYQHLNQGKVSDPLPLNELNLCAPLPRAWQWLDGSAFPTHGELMARAFNTPPIDTDMPLMYQGMSHKIYGPREGVPFLNEEDGIDFEGEFGIITDDVPMGASAQNAGQHIKLIVQLNDWSLRRLAPIEMKTGFGWIQAKPACSMAPIAVTPEELGGAWQNHRINTILKVTVNNKKFGEVPTTEMEFGFNELIAHAAATRSLCAGTIIGSGTVSHQQYKQVGSCCIAERRAIEMIDSGKAHTKFLKFGDHVSMVAHDSNDKKPLFGVMDQCVIKSLGSQ